MVRWKGWLIGLVVALSLLGALYAALTLFFLDYFMDFWWFSSLELRGFFLLQLFYKYLVFVVAVLFFFLLFFINFFVAARFLGIKVPEEAAKETGSAKSAYRGIVRQFRRVSMGLYIPLSLILAVIISQPLFSRWEDALLFIFGPASNVDSVVFGKDVSYYLFAFPIYILLEKRLLISIGVLLAATALLYWAEKRSLALQDKRLPSGARVHLSVLVLLFFGIVAWDFILDRHALLFTYAHAPLFSGPGFVEMRVILPLLWVAIFATAGLAFSLVYYIHKRRGAKIPIVFAVIIVLSIGARHTPFITNMVDIYIVKPNEITREQPYMKNSIKATLNAYGLDVVERRYYQIPSRARAMDLDEIGLNLKNVPVWDREMLKDVYYQLQGLKPYYRFASVDVGRYTVSGEYQQVYLAARELYIENLPAHAQNWINKHLRYTHGNGVVMTPAAQGGDESLTYFIEGAPPVSQYGLVPNQNRIYYTGTDAPYVLVPNETGEMDLTADMKETIFHYEGMGGIALSNLWRKFLSALYFKDRNIFFTTKTTKKTRLLFRRNIQERVRHIAPFLMLDNDPYIVAAKDRLYWVIDAYTTSPWYPYAAYCEQGFNTIRNSVKIVVDAYEGQVRFFLADPSDPIASAYARMYPGLIRGMDELPATLRRHLRYPQDIFDIQMSIYRKYHQTDPEVFYQEQDLWEFSKAYHGKEQHVMRPYYLTLDLLEPGNREFFLLVPFNPINRDNLRALAIGRSDGSNYGKIVVYIMPEGQQVYGPSQIGTVVDVDTEIAQQFTLWDQTGSEVLLGRMIILPIDNQILYVQPVYLRSITASRFPELKRIIVCLEDIAIMEKDLESAMSQLNKRVQERRRRQQETFPTIQELIEGPPGASIRISPHVDAPSIGSFFGPLERRQEDTFLIPQEIPVDEAQTGPVDESQDKQQDSILLVPQESGQEDLRENGESSDQVEGETQADLDATLEPKATP
jgi:uncharacterized membrane protein (UPF0182 family)